MQNCLLAQMSFLRGVIAAFEVFPIQKCPHFYAMTVLGEILHLGADTTVFVQNG